MNTGSALFLSLKSGSIVSYDNATYIILSLLDIDHIIAKNVNTNQTHRLPISLLKSIESTEETSGGITAPAVSIPDEDWQEAMKRFQIILPLLKVKRNRKLVEEYAKKNNVSPASIYNWIKNYSEVDTVSSLVRKKRSDRGKTRLSPNLEKIIYQCVQKMVLNKQQYSIASVIEEVKLCCRKAGLAAPHPNTIRKRISIIPEEEFLKRRRGNKEARAIFSPIEGNFPDADYPLAVVQIDHTPIDVIVVDEIDRLPIGRPWITLAIDVYSRMVCGFYISMDNPSVMSVALCIAHAILPKEQWLANRDIAISWPVYGKPNTIFADNAKEFRSNALKRACDEYGITLTWRPVATPHYGGHIERYLGTLMKDIHQLPGTTFSNPDERGEYDSNAKATMTLKELEKWITINILGKHHQRLHSQLEMSPLKKYEKGIMGDSGKPGRGLPPRALYEERILLDFMPLFERTIQDYGVQFEHIYYYSNVLRPWINATNSATPKSKRKFIFRYDPRDLSKIFFLDPELNIYYPIPYRTTSRPVLSIWELREAMRRARISYGNDIDEDIIFNTYEQLREIEKNALKETKATRKAKQAKRDFISRTEYLPVITPASQSTIHDDKKEYREDIMPFDDIDEDIIP